ncbi:hypothetical protein FSP39_006082 [Pinctada imbricata]|uniref:E3 ubiquitin-protein ligase n=1 Tax=Pinctada imbricata TaxID=66713 RepID=A0AA88XEL0_PINIB|nr:hypothetical protein FSP39_006082 [Pinctada imbricata]
MAYMVIVWEWMNEFGNWRPYDPHVSDFLEDKFKNQPQNPVSLGHVDKSLVVYSADFTTMCQIRYGTGTARPIRRQLYPDTSPPGKGVVWQWQGDQPGQWHNYDLKVSMMIEDYFSQNTSSLGSLDLSKTSLKLPYILDLRNMTQKRIETGRVRQLRREVLNSQYTMMSAANASGQSAGTSQTQGAKRQNGALPGSSGTKKAKYAIVKSGASGQMSNHNTGQQISQGQLVSQLLAGGNANPPSTNGPLTRSRFHTMTNSQSSSVQQGAMTLPPSAGQGQAQGHSHGNQQTMQQHSTSNQFLQTSQHTAQNGPSSATHHPHNFHQLTSHNLLSPQAIQFLSQFGSLPPGANIPSITVNLHGNSMNNNQGISVPGSLLGRSKGASRISPVVTNATNVLMSPAVPTFPSSSGGATHFNLPHSDRIPNNAPKGKKGRSSSCDPLDEHTTVVTSPPEDEDCCICCEKLNQPSGYGEGKPEANIVVKLDKCKHMFHKLCLQAMYESGAKNGCLQCPTCKTIHGEKHGNCPQGLMEYHRLPQPLTSYEGCQTIQILYHISPGVQGPEHPHPGKRYSCRGFPRVCYLPDNERGRKVLKLLTVAWKRRLTFTIGMSTTTGEGDTVTWNEIHHKTEFGSNHSGHGYPDPNYLDNVLMELAVQGVTENDL